MRIAVIPGDGIGKEVIAEATKVLNAVGEVWGRTLDLVQLPWGADHYLVTAGSQSVNRIAAVLGALRCACLLPVADERDSCAGHSTAERVNHHAADRSLRLPGCTSARDSRDERAGTHDPHASESNHPKLPDTNHRGTEAQRFLGLVSVLLTPRIVAACANSWRFRDSRCE